MFCLFSAACSNSDYMYIRHLDFCLKFHREARNYTEATDVCINEGSTILNVTDSVLLFINKLYPNLESIPGKVYFNPFPHNDTF